MPILADSRKVGGRRIPHRLTLISVAHRFPFARAHRRAWKHRARMVPRVFGQVTSLPYQGGR